MSDPYVSPVAEPRQRSWFGRNWWWVLLVALAVFLLVCCGVCGGGGLWIGHAAQEQ